MSDELIKVDILYGHIELQSRIVPTARGFAGEGRRLAYDQHGKMTSDSGWRRTGSELVWPEDEPPAWWELWK